MISASSMLSVTELVSLLDVNESEDQLVQDGELRSLDLNEAALADVDPMLERSRLISRGFVGGRFGRWETSNGQVITITIYRFDSYQQAVLSVGDVHETLRAAGASLLNGDRQHRDAEFSLSRVVTSEDEMTFQSVTCAMAAREFQILVVTGTDVGSTWGSPTQIRDIARFQAEKLLH